MRIITIIRSLGVGVFATAADLIALAVLVELFAVPALMANIPALSLGLAIQFFGNKYLAFRDRSQDLLRQGGAFVLVEAGALLLNAGAFHIAVAQLQAPWLLARVGSSAMVYLMFSLPLWGLIFRAPSNRIEHPNQVPRG